MITQSIDSYWILSQKKTKLKATDLKKIAKTSIFKNLTKILARYTPSKIARYDV